MAVGRASGPQGGTGPLRSLAQYIWGEYRATSLFRGGGGSQFDGYRGGRVGDLDVCALTSLGEEEGDSDTHTSTAHSSYVPPPTPERSGTIRLRILVGRVDICPP